jgi:hypothetical protein
LCASDLFCDQVGEQNGTEAQSDILQGVEALPVMALR